MTGIWPSAAYNGPGIRRRNQIYRGTVF